MTRERAVVMIYEVHNVRTLLHMALEIGISHSNQSDLCITHTTKWIENKRASLGINVDNYRMR